MFGMKLGRLWSSNEKGQTMILVVVVFAALLGIGAMAVDMGQVLWSRGEEQNIADAAALAGVRDLPGDPTGAVSLAMDYAQRNYPSGQPITVNAYVKAERYANDAIVVEVHRIVPPGLRAAVGGGPIDVPADAEAIVTTVNPSCNVYPFVVQSPEATTNGIPNGTPEIFQSFGTEVTLKFNSTESTGSPGNYGLLQVTAKHGGSDIRQVIANGGYCPEDVTSLDLNQGQKVGPVGQGWTDLVATVDPAPYPSTTYWPTPYWTYNIPDNVYWNTGAGNAPWGLGCTPSNLSCGCSGAPRTATTPPDWTIHDPVEVGNCLRIGFIPIIYQWPPSQGGNSTPITPDAWGAFYVISISSDGKTVTGSFLQQVTVVGGTPTWGDPSTSPLLGYFLWK